MKVADGCDRVGESHLGEKQHSLKRGPERGFTGQLEAADVHLQP